MFWERWFDCILCIIFVSIFDIWLGYDVLSVLCMSSSVLGGRMHKNIGIDLIKNKCRQASLFICCCYCLQLIYLWRILLKDVEEEEVRWCCSCWRCWDLNFENWKSVEVLGRSGREIHLGSNHHPFHLLHSYEIRTTFHSTLTRLFPH